MTLNKQDLDNKFLYVCSLLDEVRLALRDIEDLEYNKFVSTSVSAQITDSLDDAERDILELIKELQRTLLEEEIAKLS